MCYHIAIFWLMVWLFNMVWHHKWSAIKPLFIYAQVRFWIKHTSYSCEFVFVFGGYRSGFISQCGYKTQMLHISMGIYLQMLHISMQINIQMLHISMQIYIQMLHINADLSIHRWQMLHISMRIYSEFEITVCGSCKMSKKLNWPFLIFYLFNCFAKILNHFSTPLHSKKINYIFANVWKLFQTNLRVHGEFENDNHFSKFYCF